MTPDEFDWSEVTHRNQKTWGVAVQKDGRITGAVPFTQDVTYLGRMTENHIVLEDPKISRSHAKITCIGGQYFIEDQQSENGFSVNGEKVKAKWLALGDQIQVGDYTLKVIDHVLASSTSPPQPSESLDDRTVSLVEPPDPSELTLIVSLLGATRVYRLSLTEDEVRTLQTPSGEIYLTAENKDHQTVFKKMLRLFSGSQSS